MLKSRAKVRADQVIHLKPSMLIIEMCFGHKLQKGREESKEKSNWILDPG